MLAMAMWTAVLNDEPNWGPLLAASPEMARLQGRWAWTDEGGTCQWPASGFDFRWGGGPLQVVLLDHAPGTPNEVQGTNSNGVTYRVDGGPWASTALKPGPNELVVPALVGEHLLELRKRTESNVGALTWVGVRLGDAGRLLDPPAPRRLLELYGDSNSCGYGVEAPGREANYCPATQNAQLAFAALAAESLGLDLALISASGWGIHRGYGGQTDAAIPRVWDRALIDQEAQGLGRPPVVMVVVLGDNDFAQGDPGTAFDEGYAAFVQKLLARSPSTPLVLCVSSAMGGERRARVGQVIDGLVERHSPRVQRFDFPAYQEAWGWGADWHFSATGQEHLARALAARLRGLLD